MRRTNVFIILVALAVLGLAAEAGAQGFGIFEQSACVIGRGGATVASPCPDASSIYFNPAGIVMTPGQTISAGASVIGPRGHFTDSTSGLVSNLNVKYYPIPNVYYKGNFAKDRASFGVGLFAPYGLTTDWPNTSQGRFLGYKSVVEGIYIQPTVAFKLTDKVAVGGGVDITHVRLELRQRLDLSTVPITGTPYTFGTLPAGAVPAGTDFADVDLGAEIGGSNSGTKWHAGYNLGFMAKATDKMSIGARYLGRQTIKIDNAVAIYTQIPTNLRLAIPLGPTVPAGTPIDLLVASNFAAGGRLSSQSASVSIPLPDQFVAGVSYQATPKLMVLVDYQWVHWSMFQSLAITQPIAGTNTIVENYKNTSGVRAGIDYALNPATTVRAGVDVHGAAAPPETVTPNLPEGSRFEISAGIGRKLGRARIDAYYMYLHQGDRAGRTIPPAANGTVTNNGVFAFMSNLFGVTLAVGF